MSVEAEAQHEAQLRKKPRRIIQNQLVIGALGAIVGVGSMVLAWLAIIFAFSIPNLPLAILIGWLVGTVTYTILEYRAKKTLKETE